LHGIYVSKPQREHKRNYHFHSMNMKKGKKVGTWNLSFLL